MKVPNTKRPLLSVFVAWLVLAFAVGISVVYFTPITDVWIYISRLGLAWVGGIMSMSLIVLAWEAYLVRKRRG